MRRSTSRIGRKRFRRERPPRYRRLGPLVAYWPCLQFLRNHKYDRCVMPTSLLRRTRRPLAARRRLTAGLLVAVCGAALGFTASAFHASWLGGFAVGVVIIGLQLVLPPWPRTWAVTGVLAAFGGVALGVNASAHHNHWLNGIAVGALIAGLLLIFVSIQLAAGRARARRFERNRDSARPTPGD
jgi:hypothetical protein